MLRILTISLVSIFGPLLASVGVVRADWLDGKMPQKAKRAVEFAARPFPLEQVRLLEGPFRKAQERDRAYLRSVEPDRLLAWFRKRADLEPKAEPYKGWERRKLAGHSLGHYLSACAMMFASTGDEALRKKVDYIVDELAACQKAHGDGYLAAFPGGRKCFKELAEGNIRAKSFSLNDIWAPWYTLHKELAGLIDAYRYCHNKKALAAATRLADWTEEVTKDLTDKQWQEMLACEHGGMNEVLVELYAITGEKRYLSLSWKFHHEAILGPLAGGKDCLPGQHANTQFPKIIGCARRHELSLGKPDRDIAEFFWKRVVYHHSYVTGGNSNGESFGPPDHLADRLGANTAESCNTYNMLKLTRHLFAWHGGVEFADFYERALYNHILASQNPETGMMTYYLSLGSGEFKRFQTPFDSWTCCHGTGMENHAKYGDSIYWHDDEGLYVMLFIASELEWPEKGLRVRQETDFPAADTTRLAFSAKKPVKMALRIRCPGWAAEPLAIKVNGKAVEAADGKSGTWAIVDRTWADGDKVEVRIPMTLRTEAMPDDKNCVAILYGPIVLAGDLGPIHPKEGKGGKPTVPVLVAGDRPVEEWVKGKPLTFKTDGVGRPEDVTLRPFYRYYKHRYVVYWDRLTPEAWKKRKAAKEDEGKDG